MQQTFINRYLFNFILSTVGISFFLSFFPAYSFDHDKGNKFERLRQIEIDKKFKGFYVGIDAHYSTSDIRITNLISDLRAEQITTTNSEYSLSLEYNFVEEGFLFGLQFRASYELIEDSSDSSVFATNILTGESLVSPVVYLDSRQVYVKFGGVLDNESLGYLSFGLDRLSNSYMGVGVDFFLDENILGRFQIIESDINFSVGPADMSGDKSTVGFGLLWKF